MTRRLQASARDDAAGNIRLGSESFPVRAWIIARKIDATKRNRRERGVLLCLRGVNRSLDRGDPRESSIRKQPARDQDREIGIEASRMPPGSGEARLLLYQSNVRPGILQPVGEPVSSNDLAREFQLRNRSRRILFVNIRMYVRSCTYTTRATGKATKERRGDE